MSSQAESLSLLNAELVKEAFDGLTEDQALELLFDWKFWARENQHIPSGDWLLWLILAGRGFGKTRTGAETVRAWVEEGYQRIHLIGPTASDTRNVMVQGPSGLMNCFPAYQRPRYEPAKHLITFHTGCVAETFSADEPERLRGPQCEAFWADEPCAWRFLQDAWDNLMFGFRIGQKPRGVITTTPKPSKWLKELIGNPTTFVTRGSSYDNRLNLAPAFFAEIIKKYEGTRIGRQEINAEVLDDVPGALWTPKLIDDARIKLTDVKWEMVLRIVVAIDPAVTSNEDSDETGIVAVALLRSHHILVLDDESCRETPTGWARAAVKLYRFRRADRIIGEVNNGGDMVETTIRMIAPDIPYRGVRASRGKAVRAEPVSALYEQGRVHHVGYFEKMEGQMCNYVPGVTAESPDRMDALVWAITELVIDPAEESYSMVRPIEQISPI